MITFLPSADFQKSADCLDWQFAMNRLNNQINEGIIVTRTLLGEYEKGWPNHPTTLMWKGCELSLVDYCWSCLYTWERKKRLTDVVRRAILIRLQQVAVDQGGSDVKPFWLGDERLHSSHRAILLGKNPNWYSQFGWTEEPAVKNSDARWPYFWPVTKEGIDAQE